MTKMKIGGMVLTGVGAFLILNKMINAVRSSVKDISDASKWRAYYRACGRNGKNDSDILPPGYWREVRNGQTVITDQEKEEEAPKPDPVIEGAGEALKGAVVRAIDSLFKGADTTEEASEGRETAYTEQNGADTDGDELNPFAAGDIPYGEEEK